jgi:hypothetical protein
MSGLDYLAGFGLILLYTSPLWGFGLWLKLSERRRGRKMLGSGCDKSKGASDKSCIKR